MTTDKISTSRTREVTWAVLFFITLSLLICSLAKHAKDGLHHGYTSGMIHEFKTFHEQALGEPSTVEELQEWREYVVWYYPSGTKVPEGTSWDRMVERVRTILLTDIDREIERLQQAEQR